jgi:hypothetical protein
MNAPAGINGTVRKRRCPGCGRSTPVDRLTAPVSKLGLHHEAVCSGCHRIDARRRSRAMRSLCDVVVRKPKRSKRPWFVRNQPQANRIASELLNHREVMNLRTRLLLVDVKQRFDCSDWLARTAIAIARKSTITTSRALAGD